MQSGEPTAQVITLDDLYLMVSYIFSERNAERPASVTFAHFVEVCGMLSLHERAKKKEGLSIDAALCKALGWFFSLMAKFQVHSVEELVFRKYPYVCPYCRKVPHKDNECKTVKGTGKTVNHAAVLSYYNSNVSRRPKGLNAWQNMFNEIYPKTVDSKGAIVGLFEEVGELAEAIRVFEKYPKYFAGEAADVFSYLMGIANEYALRTEQTTGREFSYEAEFIKMCPGVCTQCGYQVCLCPAIPEATVGRLAKEIEVLPSDTLFEIDPQEFMRRGNIASFEIMERLGGYSAVAEQFPFDRGEINKSLVLLCLRLSQAIKDQNPSLAQGLVLHASKLGDDAKMAGSKDHGKSSDDVFTLLERAAPLIDPALLPQDKSVSSGIVKLMQVDACRFGIITALPKEYAAMTIMLDNVKACPVAGDPNEYVMATIPAKDGRAVHLVAVTLLKEAGNNSAASAASHLLRSFPKVQDVLMVGIAGGIPNPTDVERHVRLGDIVVSDREGIIQYDNLKNSPEGIKIRSASEKPSARMLTRVRHLEAGRMKGSRPWTQYLKRGEQMEDGKRPSDETDCLYVVNGWKEEQVPHPEDPKRIYGEPKIHYGRIGAANTLLKNPTLRDALGNDHNVRAIEMEGAGIADGAWSAGQHYILIRGISDYCDPWKNDLWQGYAAIAAASYARALIESFPSETEGVSGNQ